MLKFYINNGAGLVDYTKYVQTSSLQVQDNINVPSVVDFTVVNSDSLFVLPVRSAYVKIVETALGNRVLASGLITQDPDRVFQGLSGRVPANKQQHYIYRISVTSDEYLLNIKSVPFLPAFVNRTMGQILKDLAAALAPGVFDVTNVDDGDLVPFFQYSPQQKWGDIAKQFADAARYRYKAIDNKLYFKPFGDASLGITYDETLPTHRFDAQGFSTAFVSVPPVNDAIVIGDVEAQNFREDNFIGDGITSAFPLRHTAFRGASSLLLREDWDGSSIPGDLWEVADPLTKISLNGSLVFNGGSALNGTFVRCKNGVELGGQKDLQHGEVRFFSTSEGILGGVYSSTTLSLANCLTGFDVRPSLSVTIAASGTAGLEIRPILNGVLVGNKVTTKLGHHYFLQTVVAAHRWSRYNRVYRTLGGGAAYGDDDLTAKADVSYFIYEISPAAPASPVLTKHTETNVTLPSFGTYAIGNSVDLHCHINFTTVSEPPQASLYVRSLYGPSGSLLPVRTPAAEQHYKVGFGFGEQVATLGEQGDVTSLQFYRDTVPAVGARIRLESWESAHAIARVRDSALIASEAVIAGDDGVRTAIITDLNPLPRTSEECELAARALIDDRYLNIPEGTYDANSVFWDSTQGYPVPGRYLVVTAPQRGFSVTGQQLLVTSVTTTVNDAKGSPLTGANLQFQVRFGQDPNLEKRLRRFLPKTEGVLTPRDAGRRPNLVEATAVGTSYLDDLQDAKVTQISGSQITVDLGASPVTGAEVRRTDSGWGQNDLNRVGIFTSQTFNLTRGAIEETFYLRLVNGARTSRRSKVIRVVYPLVPATPSATIDVSDPLHPVVQVTLNGDIRDIRGVEIRDDDNATVLFQRTFGSTADLRFVVDNSVAKKRTITVYIYTFNLMWEYSPVGSASTTIPAPVLSLSVDDSAMVVNSQVTTGKADLVTYEVYRDVNLTAPATASGAQATNTDANGIRTNSFPLTPDDLLQNRWIRAKGTDALGDGAWSATLAHTYTTTGVTAFNNTDHVESVPLPANPTTNPVVGSPFSGIAQDLIDEGWRLRGRGVLEK